jgi:histone deacetylase 11
LLLQVELVPKCRDEEYLEYLDAALQEADSRFKPDLVIYNAGTDILEGDPLGRLGVSELGIQQRDAKVFTWAADRQVPICMLLSGGYTEKSATVIVDSLKNILAGGALSL